jgi:Thioesterase-like superfamily
VTERSVFTINDGQFVATDLARGPWDQGAQHGGAPAALLAREFEHAAPIDDGLSFARFTFELLRPVPLGPLEVHVELVRPGRRVQLLDGSITTPEGVEVVRARALRVRTAEPQSGAQDPVPPGPEHGRPNDFRRDELERFPTDAMEIVFVKGQFYEMGPATAWFRLRVPLVAGESPSPLQRLAAAADFPNGISSELSWGEYVFINPDLTIYVLREPIGEWVCLDARMMVAAGGLGLSEAVLYDESGRVGRSLQSLYVGPRAT